MSTMASNVSEERNNVECPKCLGILKNATLLPCRHILCESCVNDLENNTEASKEHYKCTMCKSVNPKAQAKTLTVIQELLDFTENFGRENICENCKQNSSEWRCDECKYSFCSECRQHHDSLEFLKNHTWTKLSGDEQLVLDKRVFCETHQNEQAGLYCMRSHTFGCLRCVENGNPNFVHLERALETVVSSATEKQDKLENATQILEKYLKENEATAEQITSCYANIEEQMENQYKDVLEKNKTRYENRLQESKLEYEEDLKKAKQKYDDNLETTNEFYEEMLKKAEEDHNKLRADLYKIKRDQLRVVEQDNCRCELEIRSDKNVLALCKKSLSVARGATLLKVMRSGLGSSLELHILYKPVYKLTKYSNKANASFIASQQDLSQMESNLIGKLFTHSNFIPRPLKDLAETSVSDIKSIETTSSKFHLINDQLWVTSVLNNQISAYAINGEKVDKIADHIITGAGGCYSAVQIKETRVVVADENGLFLLNTEGELIHKLVDGDFCDLSIIGKNMYALDAAGTVHVLHEKTEDVYVQFNQFRIEENSYCCVNTIQLTSKHVYVGDFRNNCILQYSHAGELTSTFYGTDSSEVSSTFYGTDSSETSSCFYESDESEITSPFYGTDDSEVGRLSGPRLCGADNTGSILIADSNNNRLLTMSPEGEFTQLSPDGLDLGSLSPNSAVVTDNRLYVSGVENCSSCIENFALD